MEPPPKGDSRERILTRDELRKVWHGCPDDAYGTIVRLLILTGTLVVEINPDFFRPAEVHTLMGDAGKARRELGWVPRVDFEGLVTMMARADYDRAMSSGQLM